MVDGRYGPIPGCGEFKEQALHSRILCIDLYFQGPSLRLAGRSTAGDVVTLRVLEEFGNEGKTRQSESGEDASARADR